MLIIIVHLYDCSKTLPESFCAIIIELALSCLYCYCKEKDIVDQEDSMVALEDVPAEVQPRVYKLCELAYSAIMDEKYSFSNPAIDGLGLLQSVRSIYSSQGKPSDSVFPPLISSRIVCSSPCF